MALLKRIVEWRGFRYPSAVYHPTRFPWSCWSSFEPSEDPSVLNIPFQHAKESIFGRCKEERRNPPCVDSKIRRCS